MRTDLRVGVVLSVLLCGAVLSAEPAQQCRQSLLPVNIELSHDLGRVLRHLHDRSPTFRAQCERLRRAANLRVTVRLNTSMPSGYRAFTNIRRFGREIRADVHLPPGRWLTELVAHEFEHLLEQIEGLNLRVLSRTRGSGVREIERELFETDRAIRAGRVVEAEASGWRRTPVAD
jgi:hypothetical protein